MPAGSGADRAGREAGQTIVQRDRRKAFRPISPDLRRAALDAGLAAYARGDFFEAHELLEPAWMGTSDLAERALYQGLIKIAAGYVHAVRGNPIGLVRNLEGAKRHLASSVELDPAWGSRAGIDIEDLLAEVDIRLASVRLAVARIATSPAVMLDIAGAAPRIR
jgi:predicted metal-dependent hydrolase